MAEPKPRSSDVYSPYEAGLRLMLHKLGRDHPSYSETLVYQQRLTENISQARRYGDTDTRKSERAEVIDRLNELSLAVLGLSFNELCDQASLSPTRTHDPPDGLVHKPRIFLCHAKEDKPRVKELYHQLKEAGYHPWLDEEDLLPGQDWWAEIKKIISNPYNLVVVCLSAQSVTKRGVVQREIKRALDVLEEMPEDTIYLIPARLEDCRVPDRLSDLHWVNLFEADGFEKLRQALDSELSKRSPSHLLKLGILSPLEATDKLLGAAWQHLHSNPERSIGYAQEALELSLREWGQSIGIDDSGLDILEYLERWEHFIENRLPDDEREGVYSPYYFDVRDDSRPIDANLFRSYESFWSTGEIEDYLVDVRRAVKNCFEESELAAQQTYEEHKWEKAIKNNESAILDEVTHASLKTANLLKRAEGRIEWAVSTGSLNITLFESKLSWALSFISLEEPPQVQPAESQILESYWMSTEEMVLRGFDPNAIRSAICKVVIGFPEDYPVTASMPSKYGYLLDEG